MFRASATPDLELIFDGGSRGNPGWGYGSFRLSDRDGHSEIKSLEYGDDVTNNQAEYRTFIAGLEAALEHARKNSQQPDRLTIAVRTDSKLVVEQVLGRWKVRHAELQPLAQRARQLVAQFGGADIAWQPRAKTVKVLGH